MAKAKPKKKREEKTAQEICPTPDSFDCAPAADLTKIVEAIVASCHDEATIAHIDEAVIPSTESVKEIVSDIEDIIFAGYFGEQQMDRSSLVYHIGSEVSAVYDKLSHQIARSIRHECRRLHSLCTKCALTGHEEALKFLETIPKLRHLLSGDVRATYDGDPAAQSYDEVVFCYPGMKAITVYRIAHELWLQDVPLLPRIMTEYAHSTTGVDIHPGATIGNDFFIDHGTGVVIGETCHIGNSVKIYQGVTLGALSIPKDPSGRAVRGAKRHPTIEDDVTIYAGATILGGDVVIGKGSIIGGNVWLTQSVPPGTKVLISNPELQYKNSREGNKKDFPLDFSI